MKHQQVVVDYWTMVKTSCLCLLLAFSGYILIKMVQTVFWLPGHLKNNQKRLEDLAKQYGQDIDEDERAEIEKIFNSDGPIEETLKKLLDRPEPATEELKKEQ